MPVDATQKHAFSIVVDDARVKKALERLSPVITRYMHVAMIEALVHVGEDAVRKMPSRPFNFSTMKMGRRKEGSMINIMTGRLSKSILNHETEEFGKEGIRKILIDGKQLDVKGSAMQLEGKTGGDVIGVIGSKVPYAAIHEFGGNTGRAAMPARPYLAPAIERSERWIYANMKRRLADAIQDSIKSSHTAYSGI